MKYQSNKEGKDAEIFSICPQDFESSRNVVSSHPYMENVLQERETVKSLTREVQSPLLNIFHLLRERERERKRERENERERESIKSLRGSWNRGQINELVDDDDQDPQLDLP